MPKCVVDAILQGNFLPGPKNTLNYVTVMPEAYLICLGMIVTNIFVWLGQGQANTGFEKALT